MAGLALTMVVPALVALYLVSLFKNLGEEEQDAGEPEAL